MSYRIMFYGGLILFLLFFLLALFLFFYLKIGKAIGNLSGLSAKRNIRKNGDKNQTSKENLRNGGNRENSGEIKVKRGRTTTKLTHKDSGMPVAEETTLLVNDLPETVNIRSEQKNGSFLKTLDIVIVHSKEKI